MQLGLVVRIDPLTHEEVICVGVWAANSKEFHQIVELAMNITTHRHWAFLQTKINLLLPSVRLQSLPLAARWILLVILLEPGMIDVSCGIAGPTCWW